jgi:mannose-6-phosphate isomerase-like protein (cupin superfamily)
MTSLYIQRKNDAPKRERDGLTSYILLQKGDVSGDPFAVTWVDVAPGKAQAVHHHPEVQLYVIIAGNGVMRVGKAEEFVSVGDCVLIPSNEPHGIENTGVTTLTYISAATPAFDLAALYDDGQLNADAYQK